MSNFAVTRLLVTLLILWINLDFSIGDADDDFLSNLLVFDDDNYNQTDVDWMLETIVVLRWDIGDQPIVQYNDLRFDIDFTVSDWIRANEHVRYTIYENGQCGDPDDIITDSDGYMESWVTEDNISVGVGLDMDRRRTVRISNLLNPDSIRESGSYTELPPESESDAKIKYCVRFSLWGGPPSEPEAEEINHIDVTVALNLDMTDENVSISGQSVEAAEEGVQTSEDNFFLEAFQCDQDGNHLQDITPYNQGDMIRICVQPTEQASEVGFRIKAIDTFSFSQGSTSQAAILNGEVAANQLTDLSCETGARQCVFETLLFAHFYQSNQGTIKGSGEATLQWGGEGVDRLLKVDFESKLPHIDDDDDDDDDDGGGGVDSNSIEEKQRFLQERDSTKTMEVPNFTVLADKRGRPPLANKSMFTTERIVLMSLLFISAIVLVLPFVYCCVRKPKQKSPKFEIDLAGPGSELFENVDECVVLTGIPEDQTVVSKISGERTIASMKTSRSNRSNGSSRRLKEPKIVSKIPDDRTVTSVKSSRSNRSKGSRSLKDQKIVSKLPDDRTVVSVKSSRSNRSRGSRSSRVLKDQKIVSKLPDDRTVASMKSSRSVKSSRSNRSHRSRGSKG